MVGITSLGLDHTQVLGNTLEEIASAKAGIMKRGCQVYSAPQYQEAMNVLTARARHLDVSHRDRDLCELQTTTYSWRLHTFVFLFQCSLTIAPELSRYTFPESDGPRLPVDVPTCRTNASLAVQLAHAWLRTARGRISPQLVLDVPRETAAGLSQFRWPGRYHVVDQQYAKFYLDGAHTKESMKVCAQWFSDTSDR